MRLIDADKIKYHEHLEAQGNGQYRTILVAYKSEINDLPTEGVPKDVVKYGQWNGTVCTACSESTSYSEGFEYCPHCGAIML